MRNAKLFLELCKQRFPSTRPHQSHGLTLSSEGTLVLTLMLGDDYARFNLDEDDLDKMPHQLLDRLITLWLFNHPTSEDPMHA
jgi:hypothetical protein